MREREYIYEFKSVEELFQYTIGYGCEMPDKFEIEGVEEEFELCLYGKYRGEYYRVYENDYLDVNIKIKYYRTTGYYELREFTYIDELGNQKEYFGGIEIDIDAISREIDENKAKITEDKGYEYKSF